MFSLEFLGNGFQTGEFGYGTRVGETEVNEARLHEKTCRENLGAKLD
jgi:hypothetical protein